MTGIRGSMVRYLAPQRERLQLELATKMRMSISPFGLVDCPVGDLSGRRDIFTSITHSLHRDFKSWPHTLIIIITIIIIVKEGDPNEWSTLLVTALGSWRNPPPCGHHHQHHMLTSTRGHPYNIYTTGGRRGRVPTRAGRAQED
jgi:hypothetical protein